MTLHATGSRFVILDEDACTEEEGVKSCSGRVPKSSAVAKIVSSEPNTERIMENVQLSRASRRTETIVCEKEVCVNDTCPRPEMVADMITNEGQWNWGYLQRWLPTEILDSIATVPPPATHYGADTPGWRWSDKREFSVGSAYSVLMGVEAQDRNPKWREVWSLKVPQRVQHERESNENKRTEHTRCKTDPTRSSLHFDD
ncbi:hypothetical protein V6N12_030114 [Hibiscus sabdariffa]|uniref:Uncharacterized protein n=1 Tax=Hibiscus sabdariffa TaxID=183260 RepID=A0ABR2C029_9ROSI